MRMHKMSCENLVKEFPQTFLKENVNPGWISV